MVDRGALTPVKAAHAVDLELARQCAAGDEKAWERFVLEYRPLLYRAADTLDPSGGARELADALYAELYGIQSGDDRQSLFRYFQGRSSLGTWLRAVLAQRFVDRLRVERRLAPLPQVDGETGEDRTLGRLLTVDAQPPDLTRSRHLELLRLALDRSIGRLSSRDKLRLGCYYAQELTLAETGRVMKEHEATVSRQLARTKRAIRDDVERELRDEAGLSDGQIEECFGAAGDDPGTLDLREIFDGASRQEPASRL